MMKLVSSSKIFSKPKPNAPSERETSDALRLLVAGGMIQSRVLSEQSENGVDHLDYPECVLRHRN